MNHLHCTGWWDQAGYGRQTMDGLLVVIDDTRITGSGIDVVGPFTLAGSRDGDGAVHLVKHYIGRHAVDYVGRYDGDARLWGHWRINLLRGSWEIRIKSNGVDEAAEEEEAEVGAETPEPAMA